MTRNQAAMQAVDEMEAAEATNVVGIGHNNPPPAKQDVKADRVARAKQIHQKNQSLPTVEMANMVAEAQAKIKTLNERIGHYESAGEADLENAQSEYELFRALLEAELADAVQRRDAFIETLNEEIAGIRLRLTSAENEHEVKKGSIIRGTQEQIAAMRDMIKMHERSLGDG